MIYDDFHSFMLFYFLFAFDTFDPFPYFSAVTPGGKIAFASSPAPAEFLHPHEEINMRRIFLMRKIFNQRSIKITFMEKLILVNCEREIYMKSNFSSNHAIFHNHQSF